MIRAIPAAILLCAFSACDAGPPQVSAIPPAEARALFLEHCAICHGADGSGHGPRRGSLHRKPPDLRRPALRRARTPAELRDVIRDGVPGSDMPAWRVLGDEEIAGLAAYVASLSDAR